MIDRAPCAARSRFFEFSHDRRPPDERIARGSVIPSNDPHALTDASEGLHVERFAVYPQHGQRMTGCESTNFA